MTDFEDYRDYQDMESDGMDEYEKYEEWYLESGYDPYHLFDDEMHVSPLKRLKRELGAVASRVALFCKRIFWRRNRTDVDDIPF